MRPRLTAAGARSAVLCFTCERFLPPHLRPLPITVFVLCFVFHNGLLQSKAIEGYLARLTGLYPADPLDALVCDVIREHYADAIDAAWKGALLRVCL